MVKKNYLKPQLTSHTILFEEGFAAGSNLVNPSTNSMDHEWDAVENKVINYDWDTDDYTVTQ